jgi:hypothetical protein
MQEVDPALGWLIVQQLVMKDMTIAQAMANLQQVTAERDALRTENEELKSEISRLEAARASKN